jgi:hypothetical protein
MAYRAGKVKYLGPPEILNRRAHAIHPVAAIGIQYSPFTLHTWGETLSLLKTVTELSFKIIAYSPPRRDLITGRYISISHLSLNKVHKVVVCGYHTSLHLQMLVGLEQCLQSGWGRAEGSLQNWDDRFHGSPQEFGRAKAERMHCTAWALAVVR